MLTSLIMFYKNILVWLTWFRIENLNIYIYISIFIKTLHSEHTIDILKYELSKYIIWYGNIHVYYILSSNKGIFVWPIWPEVNCPYFHTPGK